MIGKSPRIRGGQKRRETGRVEDARATAGITLEQFSLMTGKYKKGLGERLTNPREEVGTG